MLSKGKAYSLSTDGSKTEKGAYEYKAIDKNLVIKIDRALLNLSGTLDFEFKWVDNCNAKDILDFYVNGNSAPTGRFNYVYKELGDNAPANDERAALKGTAIVKPGSTKMLVSGGKSNLSETNPVLLCQEINGMAYIPYDALNKILGFGLTKVKYEAFYNILFVYTSDSDGKTVKEFNWAGTILGTNEVRVNGVLKTLTNPVIANNGTVYVPLTLLSDCFGKTITKTEGGLYVINGDGTLADRYSVYFN